MSALSAPTLLDACFLSDEPVPPLPLILQIINWGGFEPDGLAHLIEKSSFESLCHDSVSGDSGIFAQRVGLWYNSVGDRAGWQFLHVAPQGGTTYSEPSHRRLLL